MVDSDRNIILKTARNDTDPKVLVDATKVTDLDGNPIPWSGWSLSADMEFVLFESDHLKQWRHSSHANYWIHRLSDSRTFALLPPSDPPVISKVVWAPVGHSLAYVMENDLYVVPGDQLTQSEDAIRVTDDGSEVVFNGVPDWVYEEEVVETDSTLWWSPNGETVAYLRMDETDVKDYRLQIYNPSKDAFEPHQYPSELDMKWVWNETQSMLMSRYPKPGTPNPLVTVHTFSLADYMSNRNLGNAKQQLHWPEEMEEANRVIDEVNWVSDTALLLKEVDRAARVGHVLLFEDGEREGKVVRRLGKDGEEGDDGWIDHVSHRTTMHTYAANV